MEVIAQLIGLELDNNFPNPMEKALKHCNGTWGLVVLSPKEPDEFAVAYAGSPTVLGIGEGRVFIASETSAFNRHTRKFIALKDGEIGYGLTLHRRTLNSSLLHYTSNVGRGVI
jgi:glucosamine--fructose-6-phosphate aminotransferase (isomerizing)